MPQNDSREQRSGFNECLLENRVSVYFCSSSAEEEHSDGLAVKQLNRLW